MARLLHFGYFGIRQASQEYNNTSKGGSLHNE
jgi:hypothetical protein